MSKPCFRITPSDHRIKEFYTTHNVEKAVKMVYSGEWVLTAAVAEKKSTPKHDPDGPVMFVLGRVDGISSYRRNWEEGGEGLAGKPENCPQSGGAYSTGNGG